MKRISDRDIALEPRLAGMEHNPVFLLHHRERRPRKLSKRRLAALIVCWCSLASVLFLARQNGWVLVAPLMHITFVTIWIVLLFRSGKARASSADRQWSDLADAGYPAEDAACGEWAAFLSDDSSPRADAAFVAAFLGAPFLFSEGWPRAIAAALATIVSGAYVASAARRRGNPWGAIRYSRMHGVASGLVPADREDARIAFESRDSRWAGVLGLLIAGPATFFLALFLFANGRLAVGLDFLVAWLPWFGPLGAAVAGWIFGKVRAASDRRSKERNFRLSVMQVRRRMNEARRRVHGPDAVVVQPWTHADADDSGSPAS